MTNDMTSGTPVKLILYFSIPLFIGNIFQQLYSMVDTVIVGKFLGVQSLAAVGSTGSLSFFIIGFIAGLSSGVSVLVSQKFGANDEEGVKKALAHAIILSIFFVIIITIVSLILVKPMLTIMKTPKDIIDESISYIKVVFAGSIFLYSYNLLASFLRALGDSKTPLYFLIISSILNIVLDLVFIVNFKMGVSGAAYATVISQAVSGFLCLIYIMKKFPILKLEKRHFKVDSEYIKQHLKISIPMSLQISITALGTIILQSAVNSFGSTVIAANTASIKLEQLVMQPSVTFGVTMATYVAQNFGAKNFDRIKEGVSKVFKINILIGIVSGIILLVFGGSLTKLFISDANPEVIAYSRQYLNSVSFFYIPLSLIFLYRNTLQGMGYAFVPMMGGVCELLARIIAAFILSNLFGYIGICLAGPLAWIMALIPLVIEYNKKMKMVSSAASYGY